MSSGVNNRVFLLPGDVIFSGAFCFLGNTITLEFAKIRLIAFNSFFNAVSPIKSHFKTKIYMGCGSAEVQITEAR